MPHCNRLGRSSSRSRKRRVNLRKARVKRKLRSRRVSRGLKLQRIQTARRRRLSLRLTKRIAPAIFKRRLKLRK